MRLPGAKLAAAQVLSFTAYCVLLEDFQHEHRGSVSWSLSDLCNDVQGSSTASFCCGTTRFCTADSVPYPARTLLATASSKSCGCDCAVVHGKPWRSKVQAAAWRLEPQRLAAKVDTQCRDVVRWHRDQTKLNQKSLKEGSIRN